MYIPSLNLIVEVKSDYTYKVSRRQNQAKKRACLKAGYKFDLYVMDSKGERLHGY
jgi:hypothetical protein